MKTILVPTDFSQPAQWAIKAAISIARKSDAPLLLLHVIEHPTEDSFNVEGEVGLSDDMEERRYMLKLIEKSRAQLHDAVKEVEAAGVQVKSALRMGNAFHGINTIIQEYHTDLVVIGACGKTIFEEAYVGSNANKIVRYSKCPVLAVPAEPGEINLKNIVYATSMSEGERFFAKIVTKTQEIYDSTIHLVRVNTPPHFQSDLNVKKKMNEFASSFRLKNYTINTFSDYEEERGIINFASTINADMIAMATHGRTGLAHILAGSIAENVVNKATKPVLTFVIKDF